MENNLFSHYQKFHEDTKVQRNIVRRKNFTYRLIIEALEPYLNSGKKVLDIGCGSGTLSFYMAEKGIDVVAIDISAKAIETCRDSAKFLGLQKNIHFRIGDFLKSKIPKDFDLILITEVLEHLKGEGFAVEKLFKSLKIGGVVLVSVPSTNTALLKMGFTNLIKDFDNRVGHLRRYTVTKIATLLQKKGFEIIEIKKREGPLRNFLFISKWGGLIIRVANKFTTISDILTFLDDVSLKCFGESQIITVARKPENKKGSK